MLIRICALIGFVLGGANAALVRIEIQDRYDVLNGRSFGKTGAYERVRGKAYFAVDPKAAANREIVDLDKAPRNDAGLVEFSADFYMLRPRDSQGNRTLLYEAPNRGGKGMLGMFNRASSSLNPTTAEHFGDGMLFEAGYTLVWLGWQQDVPDRRDILRLNAPVAKSVTGWVRSEMTPDKEISRFSLGDSGHVPYPVSNPDTVVVSVRDSVRGKRQQLGRSEFRIQNRTEIVLAKPATPGRIYEVVYESTDPAIAELGLAAIRDVISHLKYGNSGDTAIKYAIGFGTSQSAMLLKALVYQGFNADEKGRKVFDGIFAHVAGGRRSAFHRFTQHSRTAGPLRNASFSTTDQFPFSDVTTTDRQAGITDGLLARAIKSKTVPKIIYTNSSYEYWGSVGALLHTTVDGKDDLALPATSRVYMLAGGQHGPASFPPSGGRGQSLANFNDYRWIHRALLGHLQAWVAEGKEPPLSAYPSLASKTLVSIGKYSFPAIPDVTVPRSPHLSERLDFGPNFRKNGIIDYEPPRLGQPFAALVPAADRDGIDIAGVKMPWVSVPLGTFTGWNLRSPAIGASSELLGQTGSYIPFPLTKQARLGARDPRPSIEERYSGESDYLTEISEASMSLARSGFLLDKDIPAVANTAKRYWDWAVAPSSQHVAHH